MEKFGVHPFTFSQTRATATFQRLSVPECDLLNCSYKHLRQYEHYLLRKDSFGHVTLMLWDNVEAGLWFGFPFSRITEQNLKAHIRIKYKFSDEVANEKGNSFVLADYVFTLNTVQWPSCAVELPLFKVICYWSAFRCNATTIQLIKCNATQIWLFRLFLWETITLHRKKADWQNHIYHA